MIWIHTLYLVVLCLIPQVVAPPPPPPNALQIHTIRAAYNELGAQVSQTLHLQLGDISRIERQRSTVQQFLEAVLPRQHLFDDAEFGNIQTGLTNMIQALAGAGSCSEDIIEHPAIEPVQSWKEAFSSEASHTLVLSLAGTEVKDVSLRYGFQGFLG